MILVSYVLFLPVYNPYDFPNVQECDDINLWEDYAAVRNIIVLGKEKGKYLSYNCAIQCLCTSSVFYIFSMISFQ